jgi:carbamoylphosphate synthase small subunit
MPKRTDISKVLILGSGLIVIGQSVECHAAPGPHDSHYLFKEFTKMMEEWKG